MAIELEHSFAVPIPPDQAWDVLLDVQRVAPCMPGATVDSVEGDEVTGKIKVKVGPIALTYTGKATFTDKDPVAHSLKMQAAGKETKGAGTATATVVARLDDDNGQTRVNVHTSLNVTGRPAQFGRGVMAEVSGRIIEKFSANLAAQLAAGAGPAAATAAPAVAPEPAAAELAAAQPGVPEPAVAKGQAADTRLAIPIQELNLPVRSYNSLKSEGIDTVGKLVARTEKDLLSIKNLGEKSVGEIEQRLGDLGLALAGPAGGAGVAAAGGAGVAAAGAAGAAGSGAAEGAAEHAAAASNGSTPSIPAGREAGASAGSPAWDGSGGGEGGGATADWRGDQSASARDDDDALNLLDVAAGPILKRALPALAAVGVLIWLGTRLRGRGKRTAG